MLKDEQIKRDNQQEFKFNKNSRQRGTTSSCVSLYGESHIQMAKK